jgi:benzaldehyde dehydrogenase (NAD)
MTTGRYLVHERIAEEFVGRLAEHAYALPVGDPATEQVAISPVIDTGQRDTIYALVTASVDAGARLAAGGTYEELFYQPTVLTDVTPQVPAWLQEVFDPVAPIIRFSDEEEGVKFAAIAPTVWCWGS